MRAVAASPAADVELRSLLTAPESFVRIAALQRFALFRLVPPAEPLGRPQHPRALRLRAYGRSTSRRVAPHQHPFEELGGFAVFRDALYDDLERLVTAGLADRTLLSTKPLSRIEAARIVARARLTPVFISTRVTPPPSIALEEAVVAPSRGNGQSLKFPADRWWLSTLPALWVAPLPLARAGGLVTSAT